MPDIQGLFSCCNISRFQQNGVKAACLKKLCAPLIAWLWAGTNINQPLHFVVSIYTTDKSHAPPPESVAVGTVSTSPSILELLMTEPPIVA